MESLVPDHIKNPVITPPHDPHIVSTPLSQVPVKTSSKFGPRSFIHTISAFAILALSLVALYLGYQKYYLTPERILAKSSMNMSEVKKFKMSGSLTLAPYLEDLNFVSVIESLVSPPEMNKVNFSVSIDAKDENNLKSDLELNFYPTSEDHSFSARELLISKDEYAKFSFPKEATEDFPFVGLAFLGPGAFNRWIKADDEGSLVAKNSNKSIVMGNNSHLNSAKVDKVLPPEKINGQSMHHLSLKSSEEEFPIGWINLIPEITLQSSETIDIVKTEIWIGKKDMLVHKLTYKIETKEPKRVIDLVFNFSDFNGDFTISPPEDFVTLDELAKESFRLFQDSTPDPSNDAF